MFEELDNYIKKNFELIEINNKPQSLVQFYPIGFHKFKLKNVSDETRKKFKDMCTKEKLNWDIDKKIQFGYSTPLTAEQSETLYQYLCKKMDVDNKIIKMYCEFLTYFNGMSTNGFGIYGVGLEMKEYSFEKLLINIDIFRPTCMKRDLIIGKWMKDYACLNADGEVLIYDGKILEESLENLKYMVVYSEYFGAKEKKVSANLLAQKKSAKNFLISKFRLCLIGPVLKVLSLKRLLVSLICT